jgi:predicted PurR-regulated permease PerM
MNTQLAFAFGMLAMVVIIMIVAIVVGMVKVIKQQRKITSLEKWIDNTNLHAERNREGIERAIEDIYRKINETHSIMDSRFDKFENKITKKQILKN